MFRAQLFRRERCINHQRIVGVNKRLFAAGFTTRGAETAKRDINRILYLRQCVGELRIVGVKDARNIGQWTACRRGNVIDFAILYQQP
ncbi:hypothetical protein D3C80_1806270 [compost metagenome]